MDRREFVQGVGAAAAALALPSGSRGATPPGLERVPPGLEKVNAEIAKRNAEAVKRLQDWIRVPSIAAENRGMKEGADLMVRMLTEAGFQRAVIVPTDGQPGVFATLDAGAPKTVGVYFMYDVKQADPAEWSSPPFEAAIVDKSDFGKCVMGRGAVNQKGPESAFLAALHAFRGAGVKLPVNLVLVAEGEEEIGSPHFAQIVRSDEVAKALSKCTGIFMPSAEQDPDGVLTVSLGAKGVIELELRSTGEAWGRGPSRDVHSANRAWLDSPSFHLVQALNTLIAADGNTPAIEGLTDKARPLSAAEKAMMVEASKRMDQATTKKDLSAKRWAFDADWVQALENLVSRPTVNIEGLVGGYTGPGGKTMLPHKAIAKLDLRLVPDMKASEALAALKAHLAKKGFGDIEVVMTGGYDPNSTSADAPLIRAEMSTYRGMGLDPILWPRNAGSWPGYVFTNPPLSLAAGHFGLGFGTGAHAPDEFYVIESTNPKVEGYAGATKSFVAFLAALAAA
jgi:acetylornithine deacetylase/succinyl-diaminopimelate desuccinylase-like protein